MNSQKKNPLKQHWEKVYQKNLIEKLGWYEEKPEPSLELIKKCNLHTADRILNAGAGASTLIDELLKLEYQNIIATDISENALNKLKQRLGKQNNQIEWIIDDLSCPEKLLKLQSIDLWHDRAVLHFFTEDDDQNTYFQLLKKLLKPGGFVVLATFNPTGATKCSGLPVFRYSNEMFQERLGNEFNLIETSDYTYTMPSGDTREYVYSLFRRNAD